MIIDNYKFIRTKLDFSDPDKFYFIELMQRKKDDNSFPCNNRMVKCYFVYSLEYYDLIESEVKKLSDCTGSRVYILLNRRSYKDCLLHLLKDAAQIALDHNYQHMPKLVSSVVGKYNSESNKNWVVDVDEIISKEDFIKLHTFIDDLEPISEPNTSKLKFIVPTLHGFHLITSPFNIQKFSQIYPNIDVHKDNPTLLYFKHE